MPDNRPIGVFDSGVGGLTVLRALQEMLPLESTVYLGDLARCPYGPRPQLQVRDFAIQVADYLALQDIKLLVVACNTATAAAYEELRDRYPFPVIGVVAPGAREAARASKAGRIGVVATDGTVASRAYSRAIMQYRPEAAVTERAASWLVPIVESGVGAEDEILHALQPIMHDMTAAEVDTLILGCTHFPLVHHLFDAAAGPSMMILDSATTTAAEVRRLVLEGEMEAEREPLHRFLVTGPAAAFAARAAAMFSAYHATETVYLAPDLLRSGKAG